MKAFLTEWMNEAELPQEDEVGKPFSTDNTLPDEIYIPPDCPNDVKSIQACIDTQRTRKDAA